MSLNRASTFLFIASLAVGLTGCPDGIIGVDDDDSGGTVDDDDAAGDEALFDQVEGTVEYVMSYTEGALEAEECTELYSLSGIDATAQATQELGRLQEACAACDVLFQGFFNAVDTDCAGGPDLPEENFLAFDLSSEGSATMWWKADGDWTALGTSALDFDMVVIEVEDPDENGWGGWGGNSTSEEPCSGGGNRCRWDGLYVNTLDLGSTDRPEE
jgi:hypothetical protein